MQSVGVRMYAAVRKCAKVRFCSGFLHHVPHFPELFVTVIDTWRGPLNLLDLRRRAAMPPRNAVRRCTFEENDTARASVV